MSDREPVSIDGLIVLLRNCDPTAEVIYDFPPYQFPTEVESFRGFYNMPALGHAGCGRHSSIDMAGRNDAPKVSDLIQELEKAISGEIYEGWKGGEYTYCGDDFLWVANRGDGSNCAIVGVIDNSYRVILRTAYTEY